MIRTLPNGKTDHAPVTSATYGAAHDQMKRMMADAQARGVAAVELANACLVFVAASIGTGDLAAETVARTLEELIRIRPQTRSALRSAAVLAVAAELDAHLSDDGIAALVAFTARRPGPGSWAALVETAAQLDGSCRGMVACPDCRARKLGGEIERGAAKPVDN